jgi:hypothetical protein
VVHTRTAAPNARGHLVELYAKRGAHFDGHLDDGMVFIHILTTNIRRK